jgi:hypothetical protein
MTTFPFFFAWRHSQASSNLGSLNQMYLVMPADEKCPQNCETIV